VAGRAEQPPPTARDDPGKRELGAHEQRVEGGDEAGRGRHRAGVEDDGTADADPEEPGVRAERVDERPAAQLAGRRGLGRSPLVAGGGLEAEPGDVEPARHRDPAERGVGQRVEDEEAERDDRRVDEQRRDGHPRARREAAVERGGDDERQQRPRGEARPEPEAQAEEDVAHLDTAGTVSGIVSEPI